MVLCPATDDAQVYADNLHALCFELLDTFFPLVTVKLTSNEPSFMSADIKLSLRKKNKLMHSGRLEEADALSKQIGRLIDERNVSNISNIDCTSNAKELWDIIRCFNNKTKRCSGPTPFSPEIFNEHYATVSADAHYCSPSLRMSVAEEETNYTTEPLIFSMLDKLKSTATRPDGVPSWFF